MGLLWLPLLDSLLPAQAQAQAQAHGAVSYLAGSGPLLGLPPRCLWAGGGQVEMNTSSVLKEFTAWWGRKLSPCVVKSVCPGA